MVKDAEAHAEEDARHKEEVEVRNNCDSLVNATEQTIRELGDKVPADTKDAAQAAVDKAKAALAGTDLDAVRAAMEDLQQAGYKLAEVVYSASGADAAAGQDAGYGQYGAPDTGNDGPIEADYEVIDEDK